MYVSCLYLCQVYAHPSGSPEFIEGGGTTGVHEILDRTHKI